MFALICLALICLWNRKKKYNNKFESNYRNNVGSYRSQFYGIGKKNK